LIILKDFQNRNINHRLNILKISQKLSALHIGPAFSCIEMIDFILNRILMQNKEQFSNFILSKGHGAMALYAVLNELGVMSKSDFESICQPGSKFGGHPDRGNLGIVASTGSLGHGLPISVGIALGKKDKQESEKVIVLLSDGEMMEGSNWEALLLIPSLKLSNIWIFIDHNKSISRGKISELHPNLMPISEKLKAFGWDVLEADGHNLGDLENCYRKLVHSNNPKAVVCHTVKGKGVSFMENNPIWAYRSPNSVEFERATKELMSQIL